MECNVSSDVRETLNERGARYGSFARNSEVFEGFMAIVNASPNAQEGKLSPAAYHALSMFGTKLCRILTGDPNYDDNWRDIAGYATLMVDICNGKDP